MESNRPKLGITMGDPSGVGPEIVLSALCCPDILALCEPIIFGDKAVLERAAKLIKRELPNVEVISSTNINSDPKSLNADECGSASLSYLDLAFKAVTRQNIDAIVTAPINKAHLRAAGSPFKGHTDYLAEMSSTKKYAMMFCPELPKTAITSSTKPNVNFCVSLVTIHEPIAAISELLSIEKILDTITLTNNALINDMKITKPRIAVLGLNPHAGEGGMLGREEDSIIKPAIIIAQNRGVSVDGPFPADTLFRRAFAGEFDAVVAMYHDQGLIPIKTLDFERMVNITLGLPFIRTSVDHGTADDIAWKGKADSANMIAAIRTGAHIALTKGTL